MSNLKFLKDLLNELVDSEHEVSVILKSGRELFGKITKYSCIYKISHKNEVKVHCFESESVEFISIEKHEENKS